MVFSTGLTVFTYFQNCSADVTLATSEVATVVKLDAIVVAKDDNDFAIVVVMFSFPVPVFL